MGVGGCFTPIFIVKRKERKSMLANIITIIVLALIIGSAVVYIWKEKKKGTKCIGCPASGNCPGHCHANAASKKK